jgi:hypothetical protein
MEVYESGYPKRDWDSEYYANIIKQLAWEKNASISDSRLVCQLFFSPAFFIPCSIMIENSGNECKLIFKALRPMVDKKDLCKTDIKHFYFNNYYKNCKIYVESVALGPHSVDSLFEQLGQNVPPPLYEFDYHHAIFDGMSVFGYWYGSSGLEKYLQCNSPHLHNPSAFRIVLDWILDRISGETQRDLEQDKLSLEYYNLVSSYYYFLLPILSLCRETLKELISLDCIEEIGDYMGVHNPLPGIRYIKGDPSILRIFGELPNHDVREFLKTYKKAIHEGSLLVDFSNYACCLLSDKILKAFRSNRFENTVAWVLPYVLHENKNVYNQLCYAGINPDWIFLDRDEAIEALRKRVPVTS